MNSLLTAGIVLGFGFAASVIGMLVASRLPQHHFSTESRDVVKLGLGVIATLMALVLGLLVASSKGTYDAQDNAVKQLATDVSLLDRVLANYGPETKEHRQQLREIVTITVERLWPDANPRIGDLAPDSVREAGDQFSASVAELQPTTDFQRALKARAMDLVTDLAKTRYGMYTHKESSVPVPFLVVLVLWLVTLFAGYGLLAPRNPTIIAMLIVCAISIAAALYLILEMGRPFSGVIQVSSAPLQQALSQVGK
jgi:hypothetical protein